MVNEMKYFSLFLLVFSSQVTIKRIGKGFSLVKDDREKQINSITVLFTHSEDISKALSRFSSDQNKQANILFRSS